MRRCQLLATNAALPFLVACSPAELSLHDCALDGELVRVLPRLERLTGRLTLCNLGEPPHIEAIVRACLLLEVRAVPGPTCCGGCTEFSASLVVVGGSFQSHLGLPS